MPGANGPAISLGGVGHGGIGDLLMAFQVQERTGGSGFDCFGATYTGGSTQFWTTGTATGRVVRPAQGEDVLEFSTTGEPFDCSMWTTENSAGTIVGTDTTLNATPGTDAATVRRLDD
jgi:hypothetical protein